MAWPVGTVTNENVDMVADKPYRVRADLLTAFGYINSIIAERGQPNGIAPLNSNGKVPDGHLTGVVLFRRNNLSDLASAETARSNLSVPSRTEALLKSGGTMTGALIVNAPTAGGHPVTLTYLNGLKASEATANRLVERDSAGRAKVATPSAAGDIANKGYVDSKITSELGDVDTSDTSIRGKVFKVLLDASASGVWDSVNVSSVRRVGNFDGGNNSAYYTINFTSSVPGDKVVTALGSANGNYAYTRSITNTYIQLSFREIGTYGLWNERAPSRWSVGVVEF